MERARDDAALFKLMEQGFGRAPPTHSVVDSAWTDKGEGSGRLPADNVPAFNYVSENCMKLQIRLSCVEIIGVQLQTR
jgi:hypothetical protein